jgi:hypothetical protein
MQLWTSEIEFLSFGSSAVVKLDVPPGQLQLSKHDDRPGTQLQPLLTPSESQPLADEEGEKVNG